MRQGLEGNDREVVTLKLGFRGIFCTIDTIRSPKQQNYNIRTSASMKSTIMIVSLLYLP